MYDLGASFSLQPLVEDLPDQLILQLPRMMLGTRGKSGYGHMSEHFGLREPSHYGALVEAEVPRDFPRRPAFAYEELGCIPSDPRHVFVSCIWHMHHPTDPGDAKLLNHYAQFDE